MFGNAAIVREKFSLEFVGGDAEVVAFKSLLNVPGNLPELILFDPEAAQRPASQPVESGSYADPVDELRKLFAAVE